MSISLFTDTSLENEGTCKNNPTPPDVARLLCLFSVPIIMQEQEEKAYQQGKETKHWLPS